MSDRVIVRVPVIRETDCALLLNIDGQQVWASRRYCRHKSIHNRELEMSRWLADKLGLSYFSKKPRVPDLETLIDELSFDDGVAINPKSNQPHQQKAFDKLHRLSRFALMMQMRAGKTKVAIDMLCNHFVLGRIGKVLWLCPNSAVETAAEQWRHFAVVDVPLQITALETVSGCGKQRLEKILSWFTPDCAVIIDESQMIKNDRAVRSARLDGILAQAAVVGILSGTPITQNIQDLYNQVKALDWRIFGYRNAYQFQRAHLVMSEKYPGLIRDVVNIEYLADRLNPFVFEWFTNYKDRKICNRLEVVMTPKQYQLYEAIKAVIIRRLRDYREQPSDIYLMFTALQSVLSGHVSKRVMQRIFGCRANAVTLYSPKLDALLSYLKGLDEQVVIWCNRRHELISIAKALPHAYTVCGEMDANERHQVIQKFRGSRNGILIAMVQVAKRAIEMSECNKVVYYGHGFDFESREQSEWRTLLPGKTAVCHYTDLIYHRSLDERILQSHGKKRSVVREFLDLLKSDRGQAIKQMESL